MSSGFSFILYLEILLFGVIIAVTSPFIIDDIHQKFKCRRLVDAIIANSDYEKYDVDLIEILAKGKNISLKYMKYILNQLVVVSHDENKADKLKYFIELNQNYLSDEIYNNLPSKIGAQIKSLRSKLESSDEPLVSNLTYNIQELVDESNFRRKLNQSLTIVSIVVGLISIASPFLNFLYK